ncbi:Staphylococcal respiratory response protein A [Actinomyces bovis]|uniref:Staphylococcal respiratory response protein A n=1 Tax=Actinomyces bovis TaxID=1658 RepID=A0ABY1VMS9_9ACTO|nr:Staphylococcal respiratory response protein A [Actinomyces bovis]VEG52817.1 Staphylococcal respiratory response protein A [Actinomyces israelii]
MPLVLVVDDESGIRRVLRAYLERDGFQVIESADGAGALAELHAKSFDAVLLDIGLPDVDGLEVMRRARQTRADLPILLVTARAEEIDLLVGLGAGADDHVSKPFSPREVVARLRAVLRRCAPGVASTQAPLRFPHVVIDTDRREVQRDGLKVSLTALEFDLLTYLCANPGRVLMRRQLLDAVWGPGWGRASCGRAHPGVASGAG